MKNEIILTFEKILQVLKKSVEQKNYIWKNEEKKLLDELHSYYSRVKSLIIVRLDAIGDSLLFTNSIKQIRLLFPEAKITYMCYLETKEIIDRCEYIDVPIYIDRKQLSINKDYREKVYASMQGYQFDLLINPLFSREFLAEEIIHFVRADFKIGLSGDDSNIDPVLLKVTNTWYDYILETDKTHNKFELHRNAEIVKLLGGNSSQTELPELWTNKGDSDFIANFISQYYLDDYAVIFPGTKGGKSSVKYWGSEKYARLTNYIQQNSNLKVILLGGPDEEEICNEIVSLCQSQPIVFQGQFSIWKSIELVRRSKFYFGSDTSIAHFSAALKVPTIVLLGGGHFGRFFPYPDHNHVRAIYQKMDCYNCNWKCTQPINRCIKDLSIDDAKETLNELSLLSLPKNVKTDTSSRSKLNIIAKRGSLPRIDLLLPPSNGHSWHLKDAWVPNLKAAGMLNRAFYFSSDRYDHFFEYLKKGANSDIILAPGGDHHLYFLHDTQQKIDLWNKYKKTKICYSYESTLETQYPFYEVRAKNATKVFTHFLVADEIDVKYFRQNQREAIWFPQFVDEKFFTNFRHYSKRKNKIFFKGKLWNEYKKRQKIIESLSKMKLIDVVDLFLANSQLVENYNSYKAVINPPGVFGGFNVRTFEAMACGSLLFQFLPKHRPLNNSLFEHGKQIIYFDPNQLNVLTEQIHDFLNNADCYESIAENGYNEVLANHTLTKRLDTLLDWISIGKIPIYPAYKAVREEGLERKITPEVVVLNKDVGGIKVSAIVSVYNSEKFIEGCLADLIEQTLYKKGELEIVIVNSGSQQGEDEIITEYQSKHKNIKYVKTEREPIYKAWNRGIKIASGKYVTNANTDDRHRNDALEKMCVCLESDPSVDVVYADQFQTKVPNDNWESTTVKIEQNWSDYDPDYLHFGCFIGPQPMWKKSLHDKFGYFSEELKVVGDYEFWLRISREAKFYHLPEKLGLYYYSTSSAEHRDKSLTDSEHAKVQFYYMAKYMQHNADITRIKSKLAPFNNIEVMKDYLKKAFELLNKREQALVYEESIKKYLNEAPQLPDEEVISKIEYFIGEIETEILPVNADSYLEILNMFRGAYCLKLGDINGARKSYEKALAANGNSSEACERLGEILVFEEDYSSAKTMFEWATKNSSGNKLAQESLSKVNLLLGLDEFHNSLV